MTFIRKVEGGFFQSGLHVCRRGKVGKRVGSYPKGGLDWFIVRDERGKMGTIPLGTLVFPKGFIGKKIRLKVEVIA